MKIQYKNRHRIKINEDNYNCYYVTEHGLKIVPHNETWAGYYKTGKERCKMVLVGFVSDNSGHPPGELIISIRSWEDLIRQGY